MERFQSVLLLAVERYEPRLANISVSVVPTLYRHDFAQVHIRAQVRVGVELQRIDFEMQLGELGDLVRIV